ncbi:sodium:solute symporter family protein [Telmatospirillum siberiense]|uniref:Transporter n=1 Tax=Telmatospirillum siberiense TaxID=382514 RepID=A0A2N3PP03_9PROT|nr:sodium:solute symporter family protein [Telmatospirillum siberiense]PKU22120.1 transporter [Telmatospirillum siberiense]
MISLTIGHWISLAATLAVILAVTVYSTRSVRSAVEFSLCGRSSGAMLIAGGISGTCIGGSATIGTAQMAYSYGLSAWWFTMGEGLGLIVLAAFYAYPLRKSGLETLPQYLGRHYGGLAGPLTSLISSLGILFSAVASVLSGIAMVELVFGMASWQAAALIISMVVACVCVGGLKGAGVSGLLKMGVLWVTLFAAGAVATLALGRMPDFDALFPAFPWFSPIARGLPDCLGNVASLIVGMICTQTYIQAVYSASDTKVAAVGTLVAAAITIPVGLPSVAIGMVMHVTHPDIKPILALPMYLVLHLPAWLGGIGLAGILFSIVGSVAGLALGIGTMLANDIGRNLFHVTGEGRILGINRLAVLAVTILATLIALSNANSYVLDWNYMSMALRGGGVFVPMTLAIFWPRRLSAFWAVLSMAASTVVAVVGRFGLDWPVNPLFTALAVSLMVVGVGLVVGLAGQGIRDAGRVDEPSV